MKPELRCVTLTGADDSVVPGDLIDISREFPFVEWGILVGSSMGSTRFPSRAWIDYLLSAVSMAGVPVNLSLHICGVYIREIRTGHSSLRNALGPKLCEFQRAQLNWHAEYQGRIGEHILKAFRSLYPWEPEIIFQLDGVNEAIMSEADGRFRCSGLFDASHGAGELPSEWRLPRTDMQCGWAGGLGPDNVAEQLEKIRELARGPFWIDMETKLFTDGEFDLTKCRAVLEAVADRSEILTEGGEN